MTQLEDGRARMPIRLSGSRPRSNHYTALCCSLGDIEYPLREGQAKESPPSLLKGADPFNFFFLFIKSLWDPDQQPKTSKVWADIKCNVFLSMPFSPHWVSWRSSCVAMGRLQGLSNAKKIWTHLKREEKGREKYSEEGAGNLMTWKCLWTWFKFL